MAPAAAASTSCPPSRSSGGIHARPSARYSASSSGVGTNSLPRQRAAPRSEQPSQAARASSWARCASLPVACTSTAPALSGGVTMTWAVVPPTNRSVTWRSSWPANSCTPGTWPRRAKISAAGASATTTTTSSFTTSHRRRTSPAAVARRTPGTRPSASTSVRASSAAWWASRNALAWRRKAMLFRMLSAVFWPKRGSPASRPSAAAASRSGRESMPSVSWIWRILATPRPEMASISTRPGGTCPRNSSSSAERPVPASSLMTSMLAGPTPFVAASDPSSSASRRVPGRPPTTLATVRKVRTRKTFSPRNSMNAATCSSASATPRLSIRSVMRPPARPPRPPARGPQVPPIHPARGRRGARRPRPRRASARRGATPRGEPSWCRGPRRPRRP